MIKDTENEKESAGTDAEQRFVMCGNCPFLKIIPAHRTWVDIPEDHIDGWAEHPRENICLVEGLWRLGFCGDLIDIEGTPIRSDKCLELTKNIINQFCTMRSALFLKTIISRG